MLIKKTSNIIAKFYHKNFWSMVRHQIFVGGRASTKSSRNSARIIKSMLRFPDEEWIVVRQDSVHHRNSTLRELITACERLGLVQDKDFFVREGGFLSIKIRNPITKTISEIKFAGLNDFRKLKGFKPSHDNKYFGGIWFFEIDEFNGSYHMKQAISTFGRGKKPHFICLYEFNPPERGNWVYNWVDEMRNSKNTLYEFNTYLDLTEYEKMNFLGKDFLEEIEEQKITCYELYENIYLGKFRKLQGACYPKDIQLIDDLKGLKFEYINVGIDYGDMDATTAIAIGVNSGKYYIIGQYYTKDPNKDINDKAVEISDFLNDLSDTHRCKIYTYCETNPMSLYILLKKETYVELRANIMVKKINKSQSFGKSSSAVQERIDAINVLIGRGDIFMLRDLKKIREAMGSAVYSKNNQRVDNGSSDIDSLDAMEYAIKSEIFDILVNYYGE